MLPVGFEPTVAAGEGPLTARPLGMTMRFYYMFGKRKVILVPANKAYGEVELKLPKL